LQDFMKKIIHLVNELFVPLAQQTSLTYCR
jgi:hypothetical protein